jgi:serine protease Do
MVARSSAWVLLGGIVCVGAGAALGRAWPDRSPQPIWSDAPPIRHPAMLPSFADVVRRVGAGVVTVRALRAVEAADSSLAAHEQPGELRAVHAGGAGLRSGSGFVVNANGLVVTSRHVVVGALDVEVIVPDRGPFHAELVGEDRATDLALLRLADAPPGLTALPLANGTELQAGDWIVAVGNPFGFAQTVTAGIVSFVGRHLPHSDFGITNDFLQISAPVNPGSSGCPVLDLNGRVVGVTTQAPEHAQGISFAVPGHAVKWTLAEMERRPDGRVRRGYLGIEFASRTGSAPDGQRPPGVVIVQVIENEPAHRAGLRPGDVVLRVDGAPVHDAQTLHERIVRTAPGSHIALQLLRSGSLEKSVVAVLGEVGDRHERPQ